jgi:hypothetical protein
MYGKLGYYKVDEGIVLVNHAKAITSVKGWEANLVEYMKPLLGSRPLASLRSEDIHALKPAGMFAEGTQAKRQMDWLLLSFLAGCGEDADEKPAVIGYRRDPTLTIDEVADLVIGKRAYMPTMADLKLDAQVRTSGIPAVLQMVLRRIAAVGRDRPNVINAIRTHLSDVGWRASRGLPISPAEKSLLLCYGNTSHDDGPGRTEQEKKSGAVPIISVAQHESDLVHAIWSEVQAVTLSGPYSRFFSVTSNANKEELILAIGPHASTLSFLRGYRLAKGWFDEFVFEGHQEFEWDRSAQLTAAREAGVAFNTVDKPFTGTKPLRVGTIAAEEISASYDEDGIEPEITSDSGPLKINQYIWKDDWLDRRLTTDNGANAADWMYSKALLSREFGSCEVGMTDLSDFRVVDEKESESRLNGQTLYRSLVKKVAVYIPTRGASGIEKKEVDLSVLLKGFGEVEFLPAFTEFTQLPRSVLFKERPNEEALVALQHGLSREEMLQGQVSIRMTLNYYLITQALGDNALAIGEESVLNIARALCTRRKQKES